MKKNLHPPYFPKASVTCNCGASFEVGATMAAIHVEICSACHPFYTGKQNLVDTAGRVDKFRERTKRAAELKETSASRRKKTEKTTEPSETEKLKALKKILIKS